MNFTKLSDFAYEKDLAASRCKSYGDPFIEHFHKIYTTKTSNTIDFWCKEMTHLYHEVKKIVLKYNKKTLDKEQIEDWFFTVGSLPEVIFDDKEEAKKYTDFYRLILDHNMGIREAIKNILNK